MNRSIWGMALGAALITPMPVLAQQPGPGHDALQAALDSGRVALDARGASAAVIFPDGTLWTGVSGEARDGVAVEPATVFEVGSITKTFTAALTTGLASEGVLDLDDPVSRWVDDAPGPDGITLRQLLQHTSGLADAAEDPQYIPAMISAPARVWKPRDSFEYLGEAVGAPGESFHYSSSGYLLAGLAVEAAAGRSLDALFRERIFEPFGLERTVFGGSEEIPTPVAHPFIDIDGDGSAEDLAMLVPSTAFRTAAWAAGAILSNAADLARWMRALHTGEALPSEAYQAMTVLVDRPDGRRYGLGVLQDERLGFVRLGHEGNSAGYSAAAWHLPSEGFTVVVLTNVHLERVEPVVAALLDVGMAGR